MIDDRWVRQAANAVAAVLGSYWLLRWFWPAPFGVLVQGMVIGGLTALIAFGIALVYRSNRIINFAQGDLGGVPATFAILLILGPANFPYFAALPIAIAGAVVLGAFVEFVFIRRFFKAPRLILTVVTIGVSQILAGVATFMPRAFDFDTPPQNIPEPFDFTFTIGKVVFHGDEVVAMIVVPLVILALVAFFRYTDVGIAVRASAESADRAALLGVPVKRIQTVVWVVATVLATIAIFLRAGIVGLPIGSVLGPTILIRALAAAVIGRMERFPTIFVASLALGVIESSIVYDTGKSALVSPILFVIVIAAMLLQRRGQAVRVDDEQASNWQAAREVRPIPRELASLEVVRWSVRGLGAGFVLLLLGLPLVLDAGQINLAAVVAILATVCVSLVVLTGWAGQVSLGQMGFFGIGAAVAGYVTADRGWDLSIALLLAGAGGALAAMVIGLPALRIRGLFLAVVTLAFALAVSNYVLDADYLHWVPERADRIERVPLLGRVQVDTEERMYYLALAGLGLSVAAVRGIRRSRTGRVLIGVRENPRAAQAFGVNTTSAKLTAFAVSGFIAAFAGAIFVHHQQSLGISSYTVDESRRVFSMVVIGGLGSVPGALLGATVIQGIEYFRNSFPEVVRPYLFFLSSGIGLILVLLIVPGGFSQILYDLRDRYLRWVARRRGILVPSLVADTRVEPTAFATGDGARAIEVIEETEIKVPQELGV